MTRDELMTLEGEALRLLAVELFERNRRAYAMLRIGMGNGTIPITATLKVLEGKDKP